jgi:hypothetical protein
MSAASEKPSSPDVVPSKVPAIAPSTTGPLLLWLAIQLGAILLAALRVPLAAAYPEPAERLAVHVLLAVQVIAAGMLFPLLLRDWRSTLQTIATAVPFQFAACYLAGFDARAMAPAITFVLSWIVVLAMWAATLGSRRATMVGVILATCLTLGGGILCYLRLEFGGGGDAPATPFENASPLLTTFTAVDGTSTVPGWVLLAVLGVCGAFALLISRRFRRKSAITPR